MEMDIDTQVEYEKYQVVTCLYHAYKRWNDREFPLELDKCRHLQGILMGVLSRLRQDRVVSSFQIPVTGWRHGYPIEIRLYSSEPLENVYEELKNKFENKSNKVEMKMWFRYKKNSGLLEWFSPTKNYINEAEIESFIGQKIMDQLWGSNEWTTLNEGMESNWQTCMIKRLANTIDLGDKLADDKQVTNAIGTVNKNLAAKDCPIYIKRQTSTKKAFITLRTDE